MIGQIGNVCFSNRGTFAAVPLLSEYATATETTTVATVTTCAAYLPTFLLQAANTYVDGGYAELFYGGLDGYTISFVSYQSGATTSSLDASGHLIANGQMATFGSNPLASGANFNDNYVLFQPNPTTILSPASSR